MPNRVSIERRVAENSVDPVSVYDSATFEKAHQQTHYEIPGVHGVTLAKPSLTASTLRPTIDQRRSSQTHSKPSGVPSSAPSSWDVPDTSRFGTSQVDEPLFKQECMRIVATFLKPNSPKELNLDATVKEAIIRDLAHSTHPDIVSTLAHLLNMIRLSICMGNLCASSSYTHTGRHTTCSNQPVSQGLSPMALPISIGRNNYISAS